MTAPSRKTRAARLRTAGYEPVPEGWVPAACAKRVREQIAMHREDVERTAAEPQRPRGRPKKTGI